MRKTQMITYISILIALQVVFTRFLSIQLPTIRIGFSFIPISLASIMFGPLIGGITAAIGDILLMIIFPIGAYFPGFTLSAFATGFVYGLFLYDQKASIVRVAISTFIAIMFVDLTLNTIWLSILTGYAIKVIIISRIIKSIIIFPLQVFIIYLLCKKIHVFYNKA